MGRVSGKTAIVTGGASGIGAASCEMLAREGAAVVVADVQEAAGRAVAERIAAASGRAVFERLDVRLEADWQRVIESVVAALGAPHILVNNAGVGLPFGNVEEQSLDDWRSVMAVNSDGVFLGVRQAIRAMRAGGQPGSIVNVSSAAALTAMTMSNAYAASKGAVRILTKVAAIYCTQQGLPIRVNSIHPGYVRTEMMATVTARTPDGQARMAELMAEVPMGCFAEPQDIAAGILFLACDESRYMTGAELVMDGGYSAR